MSVILDTRIPPYCNSDNAWAGVAELMLEGFVFGRFIFRVFVVFLLENLYVILGSYQF